MNVQKLFGALLIAAGKRYVTRGEFVADTNSVVNEIVNMAASHSGEDQRTLHSVFPSFYQWLKESEGRLNEIIPQSRIEVVVRRYSDPEILNLYAYLGNASITGSAELSEMDTGAALNLISERGSEDIDGDQDLHSVQKWETATVEAGVKQAKKVLFFNRLFVNPQHRRLGVATELLKRLTAEADKEGVAIVNTVNPYNPEQMDLNDLVKFYVAHGFRYVGRNLVVYYQAYLHTDGDAPDATDAEEGGEGLYELLIDGKSKVTRKSIQDLLGWLDERVSAGSYLTENICIINRQGVEVARYKCQYRTTGGKTKVVQRPLWVWSTGKNRGQRMLEVI
jgi:GNAT superfamily N-acetyltransferase